MSWRQRRDPQVFELPFGLARIPPIPASPMLADEPHRLCLAPRYRHFRDNAAPRVYEFVTSPTEMDRIFRNQPYLSQDFRIFDAYADVYKSL